MDRIVSAFEQLKRTVLGARERADKTETEKVFEKPQKKSGEDGRAAADVDESEPLKEKAIVEILRTQ